MPKQRKRTKKIFVIDRTEKEFDDSGGMVSISQVFRFRSEQKISGAGLAKIAKKYCANFGMICKNCRLNSHRKIRCGYFEREVLPGIPAEEAERYSAQMDVTLIGMYGGNKNLRVDPADQLPDYSIAETCQ